MSIRDQDWFKYAVTQSLTHPEAMEWLYETVCAMPKPLDVCEIGSWKGGSSLVLARAVSTGRGVLTCVDDFLAMNGKDGRKELAVGVFEIFVHNIESLGIKLQWRQSIVSAGTVVGVGLTPPDYKWAVQICPDGSPAGAVLINGPAIGLLFIDGDHTYDGVMTDLTAFVPKVRPGGIVACHDYQGEPGVAQAVREFFCREPHVAPGDLCYLEIP